MTDIREQVLADAIAETAAAAAGFEVGEEPATADISIRIRPDTRVRMYEPPDRLQQRICVDIGDFTRGAIASVWLYGAAAEQLHDLLGQVLAARRAAPPWVAYDPAGTSGHNTPDIAGPIATP